MFKTQEHLQNKHKSISLFQYHMLFFLIQVVLHPLEIKRMMTIMFFYSLKKT